MFHRSFASMNSRFSMVLPSVDAEGGERLGVQVLRLLRNLELMMSRFDPHAEVAVVNREAARRPVRVSEDLWAVLEACRVHHALTQGAFDIAQGARQPGHGMHLLDVDEQAHTVRFAVEGLQLDLGGIGKGMALDVITQHLNERHVGQAFLSFGESSVAVIGEHPVGGCWPVGVEHLFEPGKALHEFALRDGSMSTSGNRPGQAHIVDPADGLLATGCRTVSVVCRSAADAEALSTALFVLPAAQREAVLNHYPGARAVAFAYAEHDGGRSVEKSWQHDDPAS